MLVQTTIHDIVSVTTREHTIEGKDTRWIEFNFKDKDDKIVLCVLAFHLEHERPEITELEDD